MPRGAWKSTYPSGDTAGALSGCSRQVHLASPATRLDRREVDVELRAGRLLRHAEARRADALSVAEHHGLIRARLREAVDQVHEQTERPAIKGRGRQQPGS